MAGVMALGVSAWGDEKPPAFEEAQDVAARFRLAKGLKVSVFAAEPQLVNPVCISVDNQGRVYVVETQRFHGGGGIDIRDHPEWIDDDLACRSVEDRLAMVQRRMGDSARELTKDSDQVRVLEDRRQSGHADTATTLADGFNGMEEGLAAGILAWHGDVFLANVPSLWKLGAGHREKLLSGFGVRYACLGSDLHGPRMGPDGKLYLSMGDRGFSVATPKGQVQNLESGAVLRCNVDGSDLEIVATGLRNPQSLAFDEYGNLFVCDNNSDKGDPSRWVYVVEGGDSGWRVGYQHMRWPDITGPWKSEKLWALEEESKAAYVVPPAGHIGTGLAGCAFYPGVGLPERYQGHFFLCDFRGGYNSGIHSFGLKEKGAGFELVDRAEFVWQVLATDIAFGPDGSAYFTDWAGGWSRPNKGRVYRIFQEQGQEDGLVQQTRKLLKAGVGKRPEAELVALLDHADQRVRLEAQFELVQRGLGQVLEQQALHGKQRLGRVHGIWGVGQLGAKSPQLLRGIIELLQDNDAEIRAQAAKVLGQDRFAEAAASLKQALKDPSPRVRFFAAIGLGRLGQRDAVGAIFQMLRENADKDAYLRHAGVMGLVGTGDVESLVNAAGDSSPAVRIAAVVALRRLKRPEIARFLADKQASIVIEAARAINDVPIPEATEALAGMIGHKDLPKSVWQRAINANFRLGGLQRAKALAEFAAGKDNPEQGRVDALMALSDWSKPSGRDRVVGLWRPIAMRDVAEAREAARPLLARIFKEGPDPVRMSALKLVVGVGLGDAPEVMALVADKNIATDVRAQALETMALAGNPKLVDAVMLALRDGKASLRREAIRLQARVPNGMKQLESILENGSTVDQQTVFQALALAEPGAVDPILDRWMERLLGGKAPAEVQFDLLEAARRSKSASVAEKLRRYEKSQLINDPLRGYREVLHGGDADAGRLIFQERADVLCVRCHRVGGNGTDLTAGPDLRGIGAVKSREYILEAIIHPSARIAGGYDAIVVKLKDGKTYAGLLRAENEQELRIELSDGAVVTVARDQVASRQRGPSPMPDDLAKKLSKQDLRNLVEYLANQK